MKYQKLENCGLKEFEKISDFIMENYLDEIVSINYSRKLKLGLIVYKSYIPIIEELIIEEPIKMEVDLE